MNAISVVTQYTHGGYQKLGFLITLSLPKCGIEHTKEVMPETKGRLHSMQARCAGKRKDRVRQIKGPGLHEMSDTMNE